jgi:tetratricopeptide (TPR) repeat protein
LGELEKREINDSFANALTAYYENASAAQFSLLEEAQKHVREGFLLCLEDRFNEARIKFQAARQLFEKAGNFIEAETICDHFIAYCFYNTDQIKPAYELLIRVNDLCERENYQWFRLMNLDFMLGGREKLGYQSFTEVEDDYEKGLAQAEEIKDNFTIQKFLLALIRKNQFIGQEEHMFNNLHKVLQFSKEPNVSERQKFRVFDKAIPILATSRFPDLAREVALESVALTEPMSDRLFVVGSTINAGIVETQAGNFSAGESWFNIALAKTDGLEDENKQTYFAKIYMQMARLEKKRGDLSKAAEFYDRSLEIQKNLNTPVFLYETKKSRLLVYQELNNEQEVEKDLYSTLKLAENYREQIRDEQKRNSFFDNEQDIYDIAIEHKLRSNQNEAAYNYSEFSNSRSLLDMLNLGANVSVRNQKAQVILNKFGNNPAGLNKIRQAIPEGMQILQYAVLSDKVLMWVLTRKSFAVASYPVSSTELKSEIESYLSSVRGKSPDEYLSRKLYGQLVLPALPFIDKDKEICLIPDKTLFKLPFSSLLSPEGKYLLEDLTLSQ